MTPTNYIFSARIWLYDSNQAWQTPSMQHISECLLEPEPTPINYSAAFDLHNQTERLLTHYPNDVNPRDNSLWSPLRGAVTKRRTRCTPVAGSWGKRKRKCQVRQQLDPMHVASYGQDLDVVRLLLEHGANADCRNDRDESPLRLISEAGCTKTIQLLLNHGADANSCMRQGWTPLHLAVRNGKLDCTFTTPTRRKGQRQGYVSLDGVTLCIERLRRRLRDHARPP